MRETISRNERLPHEFWPEVMNGGRWTKESGISVKRTAREEWGHSWDSSENANC